MTLKTSVKQKVRVIAECLYVNNRCLRRNTAEVRLSAKGGGIVNRTQDSRILQGSAGQCLLRASIGLLRNKQILSS